MQTSWVKGTIQILPDEIKSQNEDRHASTDSRRLRLRTSQQQTRGEKSNDACGQLASCMSVEIMAGQQASNPNIAHLKLS